MNTKELLHLIENQIDILSNNVTQQSDLSTTQTRFDQRLFSHRGARLCDYLLEIRKNMEQLRQVVAKNHLAAVSFLTEKLVAQLSALQRELATQTLRTADYLPDTENNNDVYQKIIKYQDYERRILAMIKNRETQLSQQTDLSAQQRIQRELAALDCRLIRCRQALKKSEGFIAHREHAHRKHGLQQFIG